MNGTRDNTAGPARHSLRTIAVSPGVRALRALRSGTTCGELWYRLLYSADRRPYYLVERLRSVDVSDPAGESLDVLVGELVEQAKQTQVTHIGVYLEDLDDHLVPALEGALFRPTSFRFPHHGGPGRPATLWQRMLRP